MGFKYFTLCHKVQTTHAYTNTYTTPNVIALGKQKIALANQAQAE